MKKFSLTHKLLAVALAFVLVAVSLPDYLSFAQQPAQEQSETDELADGDPSDDDLSGDNPSDTGEQEMEQQVVLHLQAPETVPMGTAGSFGLSAQNTAATAADVSIQLTQEEMAAYRAAEQDSTLALQLAGDSLTFTLQPGEQVEGTLSFLYPNGYSSREVVEIAQEDISIVLQQLPEEETGGTPIETIPPEGEIQPPEQGQTPPADETQQPGGEGPTDPSDEGEPTPPESGDGEKPTDPSDREETPPLESGDGEDPTDPSDGGETPPSESGDGEEATDPSDGENETLPPESGDGEKATDPSNEEEANLPDDETDPSVGEGEAMPSDEQEQVLQTVEQSTVSLTQDYQTGPDGELSEEPTTDSKPADESGTTENEGSTEPSGSESGNPTDLENTGSTDSDNAGTGDNSLSDTEDGDQQGNDPTGSQGDGQQGDDPTGSQGDGQQDGGPTGSQGDGQQGDDPTGSQGDGQQDGDLTGSQGDGQQDGDLTGSQDNVQQGNDLTGSQDESGQEQPQVSFDIVGATLTFTASFGWGELTLTAQPLETEQQEAAAQETVPQPDLSYTIEAASQNRESTGTIYTRSWSLQQVIALPQGASFVEGEAAVDGNQIRIGTTPVLSVDDQSGTAGELSAQRDGETLLVTYTKILSDWQSLEAESISDLGLAMTLHQEAIVRDESFTEGQVDVGATFTATPVTAAAEIAPAAVLAVLDTGDEQQDGSQSVTQQGSLSLPLSGEQQPEQPTSGDADKVTVTYEGTPIYTDDGQLAVQYTITVTNNNTADPEPPEGGESGEEEQPEGSDGAVTVKIVQNLSDECFSNSKPLGQETGDLDGDWDSEKKALTWDSVEIKAGESWTKTVTVLIDTSNLDSIEKLPTELNSSILVYAEEGEEGEESTEPIAESSIAVDLRTFVNQPGNIVPADFQPSEQTVYWLDNNASANRPDPKVYASKVGLEFCIAGDSGVEEWVKLTNDNMAQLGLTKMPDILCPEDNTQSQWMLSAELPTEIGYKGTGITQQVKWRMTPPAEDAEIPAGPEEGGIRPNLSEVYYLDKVEGEGSETWYYLYRDEVSFNIDLRDAVNADQIEAEELEKLLRDHFTLSYEAGTEDEKPLSWEDITVDIEEVGDGQYTLTLVNAVAYSRNGEGVHYYLKPMGPEDQETQISLDRNWPGNDEGGDYYDVECDNTGLDNVGNITDKVANGGTLVLTRQGEIEYHATKVWIDPDGNTDGRPEGHFELWRYTYSEDGGSFKEATTVTGVENVPFEDGTEDKDNQQTIIFENPNPTNPQNENLFPKYDKDGNRYVYIMKEVIDKEGELSYEQVFGKVGEDGNVIKDSDKAPPIGGDRWVRDSQDNFVYNNGTITNRINEKETVSVTKKWDAASFQASLEDVEVKVGLYGKPVGSNQNWEPVKGPDGENLVYTMSEFSAANDTMSQTVTVNSYNSEGQEMEYRFFEISVNGVPILKEEDLAAGAHLQDKEFTIKLDNGQELSFVSKRVDDEEIEETGEQVIENVIQDEITYTINKEWIGMGAKPVQFAIYQQGPNAENKLVGIVTLDDEIDGENQYSSWEKPAGSEEGKNPTLTVGDKTYNVTYQVTEDEFKQLKIEGLPRYDEHGYTYEYIALELDGSPEQTTQIDADGNYITDVVNGPGRGLRIMLRKRWIDNSDIEHREPVTLQVYYQVDEISDLENDFLLATVILGEEGEPWYELVGFSEVDLKEKLGEDFSTGNDFYKHLYIREISIGNSGADDRTTQEEIFIGEDGAVENKCVDQIEATNHTYEATYETQLDGLTVEEGEDTPGISDPLFIVTNRRLGNVNLTVTKKWQDGDQLEKLLAESEIVPVVKLVFDEEKNNAEPPGNVNNPIDYKKGTVQIGNEEVQIKGKDGTSPEEAIQPLLENGELIRELYFYNLPKYDNQGRVARYKVVELWTTADNIESGKVDNVDECYELKEFLKNPPESLSADLKSLLNDLQVSYQETSYKEMDEQKANDEQQITITNKLTGTKEIKFYKEWNDQYALEHGKRPDLYLTLYRIVEGGTEAELYADHSWDKQALTISEDGGENAAQAEQETDENYWICTFPDLPKYDDEGNEYVYYAVERLTVNDPSDFDYAPAQFKYDGAEANADLTVTYDENGEVEGELPDGKVDDHQILMKIDGDVALLEGGTFVNSLEEAVTITGRKLWNNVPLTADSADLPTVTFEVYQYLESEVPEDSEPAGNDKPVRSMTIESNQWDDLKTDDNQYVFTFDGMEGEDGKPVPFPLYNDKGERYVYILHEVTDKVSDTDWDLVYQDPVYNEYQITNTYDPQRGALSVKKLLEIPTVDDQQYYPAVTFELYQALPDENENYDFETATKLEDKTQVWTSGAVEEAAEGGTNLSGGGRLVEKVITFEDLPQYAPNGKEYKYFVVELIEGRMYYESAVVMKDVVLPVDGNKGSVEKTFDSIFTEEIASNDQDIPTKVISLTPNKKMEDGSSVTADSVEVSATFGDRYTTGDEITLQLTKIWEDQNNALKLRPNTTEFANSLKLYRSAPAQGGEGGAGAIGEQEIAEGTYEISVDPQEENSGTWTITIKSTASGEFAQYAPNGMPWVYKVTEDSTGKSWDVYITTPNKQVQKSADQASEDGKLDLGTLTNTLETTHTFTKNWANAGDSNLTWENIGVKEMDVTGTLYVGVMENGTLKKQADGAVMVKASEFFESGWGNWFVGDLTNYAFFQDKTINVGTEGEIVFDNLPLVQKNNEDGTTSQLVYVVAETKIAFTVNEKNYTQSFTPTFTADGGNLTITYTAGHLTQDEENVSQSFFTPSDVTISLSNLSNKTSSSSSATNTIATTGLTITKNWVDNNDAEKLRPESVDLVILKEAKDEQEEVKRADWFASREIRTDLDNVVLKANREPYTVNISGNDSVTVSDLPSVGFDEEGNLITYQYTVRELRPEWQDDDILNVDDLLEANEKYDGHYTVSSYDEDGSTLTVTNTLTHMDITAVKAWKPEGLHGDYAEVTFELQSRVEGMGEWSKVEISDQTNPVTLNGQTDDTEKTAWTVTWTELPRTAADDAAIEYRVKETLADGLTEDEHVTILYPEKGITGSTADKTYTVTNIPLGQITVTKKNGDGNGLAGVEFTLTGGSDGARKVITDASGEAIFDKLPLYDEQGNAITYTLTESSTPDDYIQLDEEINVSFTATDRPEDGIYWETADGKYLLHEVEYEVVNGQYFPVVHTGGSGFYWPGVLGAGAAAAGVLYLIRRKTKGHNTER